MTGPSTSAAAAAWLGRRAPLQARPARAKASAEAAAPAPAGHLGRAGCGRGARPARQAAGSKALGGPESWPRRALAAQGSMAEGPGGQMGISLRGQVWAGASGGDSKGGQGPGPGPADIQ